jgi:hypothetical protein
VGLWAAAWEIPDGFEPWIFEDSSHEVVVRFRWEWADLVDVV